MALYVTDRNSTAEIVKCRPEPTEQPLKNQTAHFHRAIGDILQADALSIYVDQIRQIRPTVKEGASHRHGASYVHTQDHTIAEIKVSLEVFKKLLGYSNNVQLKK